MNITRLRRNVNLNVNINRSTNLAFCDFKKKKKEINKMLTNVNNRIYTF